MDLKCNEGLAPYTSFRVGGRGDYFTQPQSEEELREVLFFAKEKNLPLTFLGNGSNVLIRDGGIRGVVVSLRGLDALKITGTTMIASAGVNLGKAAVVAKDSGLSGLEFAYGIPGTLGGATFMNAGAFGGEVSQVVRAIGVMDYNGNKRTLVADEMGFSYRRSALEGYKGVITSVMLELTPAPKVEIARQMEENLAKRKATQPLEWPSAGSVFKRQGDLIPAKIIDEMGLKGLTVGDAEVSTKHAGFIINKGKASSKDVLELVSSIQDKVYGKYGIDFEMEIKVIGEEK